MGHKVGDKVWYWIAPGDMRRAVIEAVDKYGCVFLERETGWWDATDIFDSVEDAEAALCPDGRRMKRCIEEAEMIYGDTPCEDEDLRLIISIAFKLFDKGSE